MVSWITKVRLLWLGQVQIELPKVSKLSRRSSGAAHGWLSRLSLREPAEMNRMEPNRMEPNRMERMLYGLSEVTAGAWGSVLGTANGLPASMQPSGGSPVHAGRDTPRWGKMQTYLDLEPPEGGSESLCPWLQPAFGPASADQMCSRRRGMTVVPVLHPIDPAGWRRKSLGEKLPQMPSAHPDTPAAPGGLESRPRSHCQGACGDGWSAW